MTESVEHTSFQSPPIVEKEGRKFAIVVLTDLDGTANDETLPEAKRLSSVTPAAEAISALQNLNIPVGIITSRSHGEALIYQESLHTKGPIICEDGAVLALPDRTLVLSKVGRRNLQQFLEEVEKQTKKMGETAQIISTLTNTAEDLQRAAGHSTLELARASADRVASAYIADPTPLQRKIVMQEAPKWGIRAFGEAINLIGEDANKGSAIVALDEHAKEFYLDAQGIIPLVFGNNNNDLKLFYEAERMGGVGVIVGHPQGGYFVNESHIPRSVIKARKPYGNGMQEAIPQVLQFLLNRYNLRK